MTTPTDTPPATESPVAVGSAVELQDLEDALRDRLDTFQDDLATGLGRAVSTMRQQMDMLHQTIVDASSSHHAAAQNFVQEAEQEPLWKALRRYQQVVAANVVEEMRSRLSTAGHVDRVHQAAMEFLDVTLAAVSKLPTSVDLPNETDLYRVVTTDTRLDRVRKRIERFSRRVRKLGRWLRKVFTFGRGRKPLTLDARRVDAQFLGIYHVHRRFGAIVEREHEHVQSQLARPLLKLEDALAKWSLEQMALEHSLDTLDFHRPEGAPSPDDSPPEDKDSQTVATAPAELLERARESADRLGTAFTEAQTHLTESARDLEEEIAKARGDFELDLREAGTFLLSRRARRVPVARTARVRLDRSVTRWRALYDQVLGRTRVVGNTFQLRNQLLEIEDRLLDRLFKATLLPIYDSFKRLKRVLNDATRDTDSACDAHASAQSHTALVRALQDVQRTSLKRLRKIFRDVPGVVSANEALTDPGRQEWEEMQLLITQLPDKIVTHRLRADKDSESSLNVQRFTIPLRDIARHAIDPPLPDQLVKAALPLMQRIVQVWDGAAKVEDIVQFNLGATLDELTAESVKVAVEPEAESEEIPVVERARQLATEALERSIDTLDDLAASLNESWHNLEQAVFESYQDDWGDVQRRLRSEGAVEERLVGIWTRTRRAARRLWARVVAWRTSIAQRIRVLVTNTVRSTRRLIARGQAVVGAQEIAEDESTRTLDTIVDLPKIQARLPLVYRKLFSFEPLTDSALLEGRSRDLVRVRQHFERWQNRHDSGVLVLTSRLGDGRTTFLNVLREKVFANADVRFISIDQRIRTSGVFAALLAKTLQMPLPEGGDLADLNTALTKRAPDEKPLVCMLDNLEHLVLQGTKTNELIEEALMFFARADRQVYWIVTFGFEAWRFITKTTGSATGFVTHHPLTPIDRATIEELIFARHRRSGIPVVFATPTSPSPLLRQRLRRARTEEKKQAILRKDYFDALHSATEQDIRLALFYWIRSADFETRPDELVVRPFEALPFRFLKGLDQIRSFTLKAFVVHNTLTLEEHRSIFRLPEDESVFVLESLLNERLIEATNISEDQAEPDTGVRPGRTYRIRRLALNPVIRHLKDKHFIY